MKEIINRLHENRQIQLAKSILESNGYKVTKNDDYIADDEDMNEGLSREGNGFGLFFSKNFIDKQGFIKHSSKETFYAHEQEAKQAANKLLRKVKDDKTIISYTVWIVPYADNKESGERIIIDQVEVSIEERNKIANKIRARMGLKPIGESIENE